MANRAPRWITILLALVLTGIGLLGTFLDLFPEDVGVWSCVAATVVMLAGIFFRRL